MDEIAYLIQPDHFKIEEVNFKLLHEYTNNIILEYNNTVAFLYFKRALCELDRLDFNIGILINDTSIEKINIEVLLTDLLNKISGINISLGLWIQSYSSEREYKLYNFLNSNFSYNFITGIKNTSKYNNFYWNTMGDIEDNSIIMLDFIHMPIKTIKLNTNLKTIYIENNMKPLKTNTIYKYK